MPLLSNQLLSSMGLDGASGGIALDGTIGFYDETIYAAAVTKRLSVNGEGWLIGVFNGDSSARRYMKIEIDGERIIPTGNNAFDIDPYASLLLLFPFKTSLKVYDDNNTVSVFYVLGDELLTAMPKSFTPGLSTVAATLRTTITGKGWVTGIGGTPAGIRLDIDGTKVIPSPETGQRTAQNITGIPLLYRFKSEVKFYSDYPYAGVSYILE